MIGKNARRSEGKRTQGEAAGNEYERRACGGGVAGGNLYGVGLLADPAMEHTGVSRLRTYDLPVAVVIVHDLELPAQTADRAAAPREELLAHVIHNGVLVPLRSSPSSRSSELRGNREKGRKGQGGVAVWL